MVHKIEKPVVWPGSSWLKSSTVYITTKKWMLSMFFYKLGNYLSSRDSIIHPSKNPSLTSKAKYLVFWQVAHQFHAFAFADEFSLCCTVLGDVSKLVLCLLWLSSTYEDVFWLTTFQVWKMAGKRSPTTDEDNFCVGWASFPTDPDQQECKRVRITPLKIRV